MDGRSKILCTILLKFLSSDHSSFPNDISLTVLGRPASVTLFVLIAKEVKAGIGAILGLVSLVRLADLYAKRSESLVSALCGRIKRASLKCLGPTESLSLTGEMRTPLHATHVKF